MTPSSVSSPLKSYVAPALVDFGAVGALTGIFGSASVPDSSFDPNGRLIATGTGSIDQCATKDDKVCVGV